MRKWSVLYLLSFILLSSNTESRVILCDENLSDEITARYNENYAIYGTLFPSVAFFKFHDLKILYEVDIVMNGLLSLYSSEFLDDEYYGTVNDDNDIQIYDPESNDESYYHAYPKLMLANLETTSFDDIMHAANNTRTDFVILILNDDNYTWKERWNWWLFQEIPRIPTSKYIATDGSDPPYFLTVSQHDGQCKYCRIMANRGTIFGFFFTHIFLLLPPMTFYIESDLEQILQAKERAVLDFGDLSDPSIQIEIDDASTMRGVDIVFQTFFYVLFLCTACRWLCNSDRLLDDEMERRKEKPKFTAFDLGQGEIREGPSSHECVICLENMPVGTKVRILPCRHSFHHECIIGWLNEGKYNCPMCKFDLLEHLEEQKEARDVIQPKESLKTIMLKALRWRRKIETDDNQLLDVNEVIGEGDLELTEEQQQPSAVAEEGGGGAAATTGEEETERRTISAEDGVTV